MKTKLVLVGLCAVMAACGSSNNENSSDNATPNGMTGNNTTGNNTTGNNTTGNNTTGNNTTGNNTTANNNVGGADMISADIDGMAVSWATDGPGKVVYTEILSPNYSIIGNDGGGLPYFQLDMVDVMGPGTFACDPTSTRMNWSPDGGTTSYHSNNGECEVIVTEVNGPGGSLVGTFTATLALGDMSDSVEVTNGQFNVSVP